MIKKVVGSGRCRSIDQEVGMYNMISIHIMYVTSAKHMLAMRPVLSLVHILIFLGK